MLRILFDTIKIGVTDMLKACISKAVIRQSHLFSLPFFNSSVQKKFIADEMEQLSRLAQTHPERVELSSKRIAIALQNIEETSQAEAASTYS